MKSNSFQSHTKVSPGPEGCGNHEGPGFFLSKTHLIPTNLAEWAVTGTRSNLLQTFLFLRTESGKTVPDIAAIAALRKIGTKTVKAHLKTLGEMGWISYDPKSGLTYIRSMGKVTQMATGQPPARGCIVIAAHRANKRQLFLALIQYWNWYGTRKAQRSRKRAEPTSEHTGGIASIVISKKVSASLSWAKKWKRTLEKERLLKITRRKVYEKGFTPALLQAARSNAGSCELVSRFRARKGRVVSYLANVLTPRQEFRFKRRVLA